MEESGIFCSSKIYDISVFKFTEIKYWYFNLKRYFEYSRELQRGRFTSFTYILRFFAIKNFSILSFWKSLAYCKNSFLKNEVNLLFVIGELFSKDLVSIVNYSTWTGLIGTLNFIDFWRIKIEIFFFVNYEKQKI